MENNTMTYDSKQKFINKKLLEINKKINELRKIKKIFIEISKSKEENNLNKVKKMLFD
jgi:hypothetical protein